MSEDYREKTLNIITGKGHKSVIGITLPKAPGLAVTMNGFGLFCVTHIASGKGLFSGAYERSDNALLTMAKFIQISNKFGFSWEEEHPEKFLEEIKEQPVPFDGATISDKNGTRPMSISLWINNLRSFVPGECIDTPPWEDENPYCKAMDIFQNLNP